ncbi:hypothetical protein ES703_28313 [subsurface metagenome]
MDKNLIRNYRDLIPEDHVQWFTNYLRFELEVRV